MTAVYKIRNVANGKFYIGSSVDTRVRFQTHRRQLRKGTHHCQPLQRAWVKYGEDCFKFEIVERLQSPDELFPAENRWLEQHQGRPHCYNTGTRAGAAFLGRTHTEEAKAALSEAHAGMQHRLGLTNSPEHRARQSAGMRGIKKSPEHVEKIRQRMMGNAYCVGRVVTEEQRAAKGRAVIEITSGLKFISVAAAAEHFGLQRANLVRTLRTDGLLKRGPSAGLNFRYVEPVAQP